MRGRLINFDGGAMGRRGDGGNPPISGHSKLWVGLAPDFRRRFQAEIGGSRAMCQTLYFDINNMTFNNLSLAPGR